MGALAQLGLLLWKNYLVQRRQLLWTVCLSVIACRLHTAFQIFEILIPCLLSIIMVILRQQVRTGYVSRSIDFVPLLAAVVTFSSSCFPLQIISTNVPPTRFDPFKVDGSLIDLFTPVDNQTIVGYRFQPDTLLYAPDTQVTRSVMNIVQGRFQYTNLSIKIGGMTCREFRAYSCQLFSAYGSEVAMVNDLVNNFTEDGDSSHLLGSSKDYFDLPLLFTENWHFKAVSCSTMHLLTDRTTNQFGTRFG
jgi:hypothetical protein